MSLINIFLIDNSAFAKNNERLSGALKLAQCSRLVEVLKAANNNQADQISYILRGKTDVAGRQLLDLTIDCQLTTQCQRCLSAMPLSLQLKFSYLIVDNLNETEGAEQDSGDEFDLQQSSKAMDVMQLIEDEILLAMPIAPMHDYNCTDLKMQSGEKPNPFAVLKGLVK